MEAENTPYDTSDNTPAIEVEQVHKVPKNLLPFNKPGLSEESRDIEYGTTRSGRKY